MVSLKISQNSQENTCSRASFLVKLEGRGTVFFCEFCEIVNSTFFYRIPLVTASNSESYIFVICPDSFIAIFYLLIYLFYFSAVSFNINNTLSVNAFVIHTYLVMLLAIAGIVDPFLFNLIDLVSFFSIFLHPTTILR